MSYLTFVSPDCRRPLSPCDLTPPLSPSALALLATAPIAPPTRRILPSTPIALLELVKPPPARHSPSHSVCDSRIPSPRIALPLPSILGGDLNFSTESTGSKSICESLGDGLNIALNDLDVVTNALDVSSMNYEVNQAVEKTDVTSRSLVESTAPAENEIIEEIIESKGKGTVESKEVERLEEMEYIHVDSASEPIDGISPLILTTPSPTSCTLGVEPISLASIQPPSSPVLETFPSPLPPPPSDSDSAPIASVEPGPGEGLESPFAAPIPSSGTSGLFQGRAPILSGPSPFDNTPSSAYFPSPVLSQKKSLDSSASASASASNSVPAHPFDRSQSKEESESISKTVVASRPTLGPFDSPFNDTGDTGTVSASSRGDTAAAAADVLGFSNSGTASSNKVKPSKEPLSDASGMFGAAPQSTYSPIRESVNVPKENLSAASALFAPSGSATTSAYQASSSTSTFHTSPYREVNTNSAENLFSSSPTSSDLFSLPTNMDGRGGSEVKPFGFEQPPPSSSLTLPLSSGTAPSFLTSTIKSNNAFGQSVGVGSYSNAPPSIIPKAQVQTQQVQSRAAPATNQFTQSAHNQQSGAVGDYFSNTSSSPEILLRTRPTPGARPHPVTYTAPKTMVPQTQPVPAAFPSQYQPQSQFLSSPVVKPVISAVPVDTSATNAQSGLPPAGPGVKATSIKPVKKATTPVPHVPQPAAAIPVPDGMMPTPHGFVPKKKQAAPAPIPVPVPTVYTPSSMQGQGQGQMQGQGQGQGQMQGQVQGQGQMYGQGQGQGQGQMYGQGQGQGQMQGQGQGQMQGQGQGQMQVQGQGQGQMYGQGQGQGQMQGQGQGQGQMYGQGQGQMYGQGSTYGKGQPMGGDMRNISPTPSASSLTTPSTTSSEKFMERDYNKDSSRSPSVGPDGSRDLGQQGQWSGSDQFSVFNPTEMDMDGMGESVSWTGNRTGVRTDSRENEVPKRYQRVASSGSIDMKGRRNFGRPPCASVCFGFGGKVVVMLPKMKPFLSPLSATPEERAM